MPTRTTLAQPCVKCPFRKDVPIFLRLERREEIRDAIALRDDVFWCHSTVDYEGDEPSVNSASPCAGAAQAIRQAGGQTQMERIEERLGIGRPELEDRVEVWDLDEWVRLAEGSTGDAPVFEVEEGETCSVVNSGCEAPAGYAGSGGAVVMGTVFTDGRCSECGEPVCDNCSDEEGRCQNGMCSPDEDGAGW